MIRPHPLVQVVRRRAPALAAAVALAGTVWEPLLAQPPAPSPPRTAYAVRARPEPPRVDGDLAERVWENAVPTTGFWQFEPEAGAPASQGTEVRVLYTDEAIYVAARLYDSHPDSIVHPLARRDADVLTDWFEVAIDGYRDRRSAFVFRLNPRGVQQDYLLFNDRDADPAWDAVWQGAARIDRRGWSAEIRIPLSQLRFAVPATSGRPLRAGEDDPEGPDRAMAWGVNFARHIARRGEISYWAPLPRDAGGRVSLFGELRGLQGLVAPKRLEVQPHLVARVTRAPGQAGNPYYSATEVFGSLGADIKYGLASDLTLTAALNPDFGQVEADPSLVNLTAYETFFPEQRPFFLEGLDAFSTGGPTLFYSRRIGRPPQAPPPPEALHSRAPDRTTILGAAKLSGRPASGWAIGLLHAVTAPEWARSIGASGEEVRTLVEPLTNYGVARVVRDFREGESAVGAIVTAVNRAVSTVGVRILPTAAYAGGLDARHRFGAGMFSARASLVASSIRGDRAALMRVQGGAGHYFQRPDAHHLRFDSLRTSLTGFGADASVEKIGGGHWRWALGGYAYSPGFEANDLGFHLRSDVLREYVSVGFDEYHPAPPLRRWRLDLLHVAEWSFGGEMAYNALDLTGSFQLLNFWGGDAGAGRQFPVLSLDALRGGPALARPAASYAWFRVHTDRRRAAHAQISADVSWEEETGGRTFGLRPSLTLRPSPRAEVRLEPAWARKREAWQYVDRLRLPAGERYLFARLDQTTASLTARLSYTFSARTSLQLYAQPFLSSGHYARFMEVASPRARRFDGRFHVYGASQVRSEEGAHGRSLLVDADADGEVDFSLADPDFSIREFRSNLVLRWEYRAGSTLFLVWTQDRAAGHPVTPFDVTRDARRLFEGEATNVLLLKLSYWLDW